MLREHYEPDVILVKSDGTMEINSPVIIFRNGIEISRVPHRHVLFPGHPLKGESLRVVQVANAVWTQKVIEDYQANRAKLGGIQ